jgi:multiple sugar transport system permease protein
MENKQNARARVLLIVSRVVAYAILIFLSLLCLFSFYKLIINSTRPMPSSSGLHPAAQGNFFINLKKRVERPVHQHPAGHAQQLFRGGLHGGPHHILSALTAYGIHPTASAEKVRLLLHQRS